MEIAGQLILGLGLFFLGMQQVGDNLRRLSGPSFRTLMARSTGSVAETGLLGLVFGVLMQSATAVTFILVSMVTSGLIVPRAALPVITWSNVGLTVLAFVVTLNIHPLVAYLVGLSAVVASMVRKPVLRAAAGVVLGVALIFFGLETMGGAAQPLVSMEGFHDLLSKATASPAVAFVIGVAVAAVLQSNTASTLLVITLAGAGAFGLEPALMLIYGTNLGAIALRLVLAAELRGTPLQLVRFEDLFCVVSGAMMVALFYVEVVLGVPLVRAAIRLVSGDLKTQLAIAFLLSNLLPALAISPLLGRCQSLLSWLWPPTAEEDQAKPKYINRHALSDPGTAMDLLERELARYLGSVRDLLASETPADEQTRRLDALRQLSAVIGEFTSQLSAAEGSATAERRLAVLREVVSVIDYLRESVCDLGQSLGALVKEPAAKATADRMSRSVIGLLDATVHAAGTLDVGQIESLQETSRQEGPMLNDLEAFCRQQSVTWLAAERTALAQSLDQVKMIAWMLHRLSKLLADQVPHQVASK